VSAPRGPLLVLYDEECGFCVWVLAWLLRWDRARELQPVPIQSEDGARILADMPAGARLESWHLADRDGRLLGSAGAAFAPLLDVLPAGSRPASLTRAAPRLSEDAYRWVADHRAALGQLVTARAKRRARALVAARVR
jgi:predicted DCC family thiol-disulfide oxidoreductase YuxK